MIVESLIGFCAMGRWLDRVGVETWDQGGGIERQAWLRMLFGD